MDQFTRAFYETKYELIFIKSTGEAFQDLFAEIMEKRYPEDFIRTRPWGIRGDRKNDGYLKSKRMLFQVYAPNEMTEAVTISKMEEDYTGALPHWNQYFDTWTFVHNSRVGLGPVQTQKLLELGQREPKLNVIQWGYAELRIEVFQLDIHSLATVLGYVPTRTELLNVKAENILKVITEMIQSKPPVDLSIHPLRGNKIAYNKLSNNTSVLLQAGREGASKVDWFFKSHSDKTLGDKLAESLSTQYQSLRDQGLAPDDIFARLYHYVGGDVRGSSEYEAAVLAVLAYYFELCDIFEEPKAT
jgi:hypothetical protein